MADQDQDDSQNAAVNFPPPPPFWRHFTSENRARYGELRKEITGTVVSPKAVPTRVDHLPLSPPLHLLQPPPEPREQQWRVFGETKTLHQVLPKLEDSSVQTLYDGDVNGDGRNHFDHALVLKRMAKSLLLNFLELVGTLAKNPNEITFDPMNPGNPKTSFADDKINDIYTLFFNFHHLLNEYRPHQARESLIALMQAQLDRTRAETNAVRDVKEKVERLLEGLGSIKVDEGDETAGDNAPDRGGIASHEAESSGEPDGETWNALMKEFV